MNSSQEPLALVSPDRQLGQARRLSRLLSNLVFAAILIGLIAVGVLPILDLPIPPARHGQTAQPASIILPEAQPGPGSRPKPRSGWLTCPSYSLAPFPALSLLPAPTAPPACHQR